ncbi:hypothetical protein Nepgr_005291 [Nepenthes gracilis]|uniref:Uncharacterized protein n=1 Tax=Nepenthes gracilis TaxID=150966 RepID=A0AAD3S3B5_NEPGR|nr:hypothetical protein Nepgr_005291 [Nepenthes gracilis]
MQLASSALDIYSRHQQHRKEFSSSSLQSKAVPNGRPHPVQNCDQFKEQKPHHPSDPRFRTTHQTSSQVSPNRHFRSSKSAHRNYQQGQQTNADASMPLNMKLEFPSMQLLWIVLEIVGFIGLFGVDLGLCFTLLLMEILLDGLLNAASDRLSYVESAPDAPSLEPPIQRPASNSSEYVSALPHSWAAVIKKDLADATGVAGCDSGVIPRVSVPAVTSWDQAGLDNGLGPNSPEAPIRRGPNLVAGFPKIASYPANLQLCN